MRCPQSKARWLAVLLAAAVSCKSDSLEPGGGAVASVVISPPRATVAVGAGVPLSAEAIDASGKPLEGHRFAWASADRKIATVSNDGVVTGIAVGTVQVAASTEGKSAIAEISVNPTPVASVRLSPTSRDLLVGQTVQLSAQPLDAGGTPLADRPVSFSTSNATVASVSALGLVTGLAPGSVIITAASEGKTAVATIGVATVPVASVVVSPGSSPLVVGQTTQLKAEPKDASGQVLAGRGVTWSSSAAEIASVSSTGLVTAIAPGNATISAVSEGKTGTATVAVSPKPVSSVIVSPGQASVVVGQTTQLSAQVTDAQGNVLPGRPISYSSGTPSVATVSGSGVVTGVGPGTATITATSEGKTGTATITVTPIPVARVTVTPAEPNVVVGQTVQLSAAAEAANGQPLNDRTAAWTSGAPSVASVSGAGVVTGLSPGTAIIFGNVDGVTGTATVTVRQVPVATVVVTPATASVAVGGSTQLSVSVKDASGAELAGRLVGWTSSDESIAIVSSTGRVSGLKTGSVTITASSEGKSGTATVTVTAAPVATVTVAPSTLPLQVGQTGTLTATARDAANNVLADRAVAWSSANTGIATVAPNGTVTAVAPGTTTITATIEGKTGSATVTVTAPPPAAVASVTVAPATVNLTTGGTQQITATPRDAQGNPLAGRPVTWASGNTNVATVTQQGLITAVAPGNTTVTATSEGKVGTVTVTVAAPAVGSVTVTPSTANLTVASSTTLTATVRDVNGATMANAAVTWSSDKPLTAVVTQSGVVTGLLPGTATITAASGEKSGSATVTVALASVATVTVTPQTLNLRDRDGQRTGQLTATLKDAVGNVLTGRMVAWASSNASVATVNQTGLVTAEKEGNTTITATSEGKSGTASVEVKK
jgi:trimeric autotransporter adhesin